MKASSVFAPKNSVKEKPDLEEAIEESDEGEPLADESKEEEDNDLSKDKYIKAPKKKAASKGKKRAADGDDDDQSSTKKAKASSSKGKGRAKK